MSLSPFGTLTFPATGVSITPLSQLVTLTNNNVVTLDISKIAATGDFAIASGTNTCGATLAPATACTLQIGFTPTVGGHGSGTLAVTDDAVNSPQTLQLTGDGVDFKLDPNGSTTATIKSGQNAVYPLLFSPAALVSGTLTFTCTGNPANSTCNVTPSTASLDNPPTTVSVTVLTGVATSELHPARSSERRILWLATLLPLCLLVRRHRLPRMTTLTLLCCLIAASGCGSGRRIPSDGSPGTSPNPPTPNGTYTIVVSATSAGLTRSLNLSLTVQ